MSHFQGNDKIYEELRGYFPPEYDLTPDELEKEIETENKKREIALGMMRAHLSEDEPAKKEVFIPKSKLLNTEPPPVPTAKEVPAEIGEDTAEALPEDDAAPVPEDSFVTELMVPEGDGNEFNLIDDISEELDTAEEDSAPTFEDDGFMPEAIDDGGFPFTEEEGDGVLYSPYEEGTEPSVDSAATSSLRSTVSWFFDFLEVFAICITCIIVIFALFFRLTKVSGESMEDTLFQNEYLVVSDFLYEPECGDIVVLQNTSLTHDQLKEPLVKRVIAVGGQSVDISSNGIVTVTDADGNSKVLEQPYIKNEPYTGTPVHCDVPEGYVFVMGDNRNHSTDSRSNLVGVVDERCIFGKALMRIHPITDFTFFENPYEDQER